MIITIIYNYEFHQETCNNVVLEIYNKNGMSKDRTYTSVSATFDRIKLDFYHRINEV